MRTGAEPFSLVGEGGPRRGSDEGFAPRQWRHAELARSALIALRPDGLPPHPSAFGCHLLPQGEKGHVGEMHVYRDNDLGEELASRTRLDAQWFDISEGSVIGRVSARMCEAEVTGEQLG